MKSIDNPYQYKISYGVKFGLRVKSIRRIGPLAEKNKLPRTPYINPFKFRGLSSGFNFFYIGVGSSISIPIVSKFSSV